MGDSKLIDGEGDQSLKKDAEAAKELANAAFKSNFSSIFSLMNIQ